MPSPQRLAAELGLDPADPVVAATCRTLSANIVAAKRAHAWRLITAITPTLKAYQCTHCGAISSVDSSD